MWIYKEGIYVPFAETYIKEIIEIILGPSSSSHYINDVIRRIEAQTYTDQETFFKNENINIIPVQNGLLNIFTKELKPFNPKLKFFNKLPVTFNPELDCPNILKHFKEVLAHYEDSIVMQEFFGYTLYKREKFEKAAMLHGDGRNGKSKTLELFKYLLGIKNCTNISLETLENDKNAVANLFNRMINISPDIGRTSLKKTEVFKGITGGDLQSAHRKYLSNIEFINYAKMVFGCNNLPLTYDTTPAFFQRWIMFDFPYKFISRVERDFLPENERENIKIADNDLIQKLTTSNEISGLLNWALAGFERLMKNNHFSESPGTKNVKKRWIRKSDSFMAFLNEHIVNDEFCSITKKDLVVEYSKYCKNYKLSRGSNTRIKIIMETEVGSYEEMKRYKNDGENWTERAWVGVKFINEEQ